MTPDEAQRTVDSRTDELLADLSRRFSRVELAIIGDGSIGHLGLVKRMELLEVLGKDASIVHDAIDKRRADGDERALDRIDGVRTELGRVEKKIDRLLWAFAGAGAVAGGSVAGFARIVGG